MFYILPESPFIHPADKGVAILFIFAAMKCLLCSAAWHLFAGCAHSGWFNAAACVDYVGISALIAASVMGIEYYGFYCRPELAMGYMIFSAVLGVAGMILPWKDKMSVEVAEFLLIIFIHNSHMLYNNLYGFFFFGCPSHLKFESFH